MWNCKLTCKIAFVHWRFITVRWPFRFVLQSLCEDRGAIWPYYGGNLRLCSFFWGTYLIWVFAVCCSLIEAGGYYRQDPTAPQSGESGCQLSFAWSDVSEEMQAGVKLERGCYSLILWSLRRNYVTTELTDLYSLCSGFVWCIYTITWRRRWIKISSGFCCSSMLFDCIWVFCKARVICQPYPHLPLILRPPCSDLWTITVGSSCPHLVIPSFCPTEIYTPSLSNSNWCL